MNSRVGKKMRRVIKVDKFQFLHNWSSSERVLTTIIYTRILKTGPHQDQELLLQTERFRRYFNSYFLKLMLLNPGGDREDWEPQ